VQGRPPVLVRWHVPALLEETLQYLNPIQLAGRAVSCPTFTPNAFEIRAAEPQPPLDLL
jgi:hypothetical protein